MTHATPDAPTVLDRIAEYRKAIAAFLVPPLALLGVALTVASDGGTAVTSSEWVGIGIAALTGATAVGLIPNKRLS